MTAKPVRPDVELALAMFDHQQKTWRAFERLVPKKESTKKYETIWWTVKFDR